MNKKQKILQRKGKPEEHRYIENKNLGSQKQGFIRISGLFCYFLNILVLRRAKVHHYSWKNPGSQVCSTSNILTLNTSFPGSKIGVRIRDTVFVNVHHEANHAVSIKWKGVKDSIDGSHDLIQSERNFTYKIELNDLTSFYVNVI
uniref:Plastocyanin-like domain-containing protein n=1 Tax=Gossypium raimondii TaxID=29730 RepID=A0A0D2S8J2_GOSRA|nr:hypothetical protein B456_009G260900 [Gossypium raimondii]